MEKSGRTLYQKIWDAHCILEGYGAALLYVDRHLVHEGSRNAFELLRARGLQVVSPAQTFAFADHLVPVRNQEAGVGGIENADARSMAEQQVDNCRTYKIRLYGLNDPDQGIVHVVGPEQGLTLPGTVIVCGDSHTSTHGAFGALAFGIGATEVSHVLATQTLWQQRSKSLLVRIDGDLGAGVTSKDAVLAVIAEIGTAGGSDSVIEFAGSTVAAMTMEQRMTICNMAIEAGARAGMIAPDDKTYDFLRGRPYAPSGSAWEAAEAYWRSLVSDPDAVYDRVVHIDARSIDPMVTWGTSPEDALPITGRVPAPGDFADPTRRNRVERALEYMGLAPGTALRDIAVDRVFIGSCTNARLSDLEEVAAILRGRTAKVPVMVVPGSTQVRRQAEEAGLDRILMEAGCEWLQSGCSMCLGMNGDIVRPGERCASTSNRNFQGRQGPGSRTHLVSPVMAAAAALTGRLTDVRDLLRGEA